MEKNTVHVNGGLLIHKEAGMTSFDVIREVRHRLAEVPAWAGTKAGHSGTLDPFATGLLIVLLGNSTRLQDELHLLPKTYRTTMNLGATSDTDDATGKIEETHLRRTSPNPSFVRRGNARSLPLTKGELEGVSRSEVTVALSKIKTQTSQIPPDYSAIKIKGKKMYDLAREGKSVVKKPRPITIHEIKLEKYIYPHLEISVTCGTGTYIRSIARDIGDMLGTGAYCSTLTRTVIGPFKLENSFFLKDLPNNITDALIPPEQLVSHIPSIEYSDENVVKYKQGKEGDCDADIPINVSIALLDTHKKLFGIGIRETQAQTIKPKKIFL